MLLYGLVGVSMRYMIDFSYSGWNFYGYQKQPLRRTIQGEIEKVLTSINGGKEVTIYSSGRTDAKVNAYHQVAHFDLNKKIAESKLKMALNSYLPNDIYINDVRIVDSSFHARYMVKSKTYEYKINIGTYNPMIRTFTYYHKYKLNVEKMKEALKYFVGTHDFTTFVCAEDKRTDKIRTILDADLSLKNNIITIKFTGNGFLKYQVRNMVGLLIKVGEEKILPEEISSLFEKKDRRSKFNCAPAEGLSLVEVNYK